MKQGKDTTELSCNTNEIDMIYLGPYQDLDVF